MSLAIFIYGLVVTGIVSAALGLIAWGIVTERRDRLSFEQGREVFGEAGASVEAHRDRQARTG